MSGKDVYQVMHMDKVVVSIDTSGCAHIFDEKFLPYDFYVEEEQDIDARVNNQMNFYHWCASRVLTLDRQYAKVILNSIGASQAATDRDRANISLAYHCVSLLDVFWVRKETENITFADMNLYDHHLNAALVDISLRGRQMTVTNRELAQDLSTGGCFPKAWIRDKAGFKLLKDGGEDIVKRELLASRICQCFDIKQVVYNSRIYEGQIVTESRLVTSKAYSIVSKMAFDVYACNHDLDSLEVCLQLDPVTYYGMNIVDYLVGNTDRHPENWGFLVDNEINEPVALYPVMDFNQSFQSYDSLEGANCQTVLPRHMTQLEAAVEAVKAIGLRNIMGVDKSWFESWEMEKEYDMFCQRWEKLLECTRRNI